MDTTSICSSTEVLQEILQRDAGPRQLDLAGEACDLFVQVCPVILPVTLADTDRARTLLLGVPDVNVRHALHAAVMLGNGIAEIATFDPGRASAAARRREWITVPLPGPVTW